MNETTALDLFTSILRMTGETVGGSSPLWSVELHALATDGRRIYRIIVSPGDRPSVPASAWREVLNAAERAGVDVAASGGGFVLA